MSIFNLRENNNKTKHKTYFLYMYIYSINSIESCIFMYIMIHVNKIILFQCFVFTHKMHMLSAGGGSGGGLVTLPRNQQHLYNVTTGIHGASCTREVKLNGE